MGGAVAAVAVAGIVGYLVLKRPGDKECPPPCEIEGQEGRRLLEGEVDWPFYGYDQARTRYLPSSHVRPPYHSSEWSFVAGKLLEFSPIVVDRTLYFIDKDALFYSLDARTGKVNWKRDIGALSAASPAFANGTVFAVTLDPGEVVALGARDGKVLWRRSLGGRTETSPVVHNGRVFVGSESGNVFALDAASGQVEWQTPTAGYIKGGLALHDGTLFGGNYAGEVFAIRASDGGVRWTSHTQGLDLGRTGRVYSTPAVAFGRVYVGSIDGRVYSFDEDSGEIAWSHSTGAEVYPAPAVADTPRSPPTVYVGSADQHFYALDARDGELRWEKDVGGIVLGAASVVGEVVYMAVIGPNIGTFGFDARTGKVRFEHELGEYNPVISDGRFLYLTGTSSMRAFAPKTPPRQREGSGDDENQRQGENRDTGNHGGDS